MPDLPDGRNWRELAACKDKPTDLFFPEIGQGTSSARKAKAICATCIVRTDCLEYALSVEPVMKYGIWGGQSERGLRNIRLERLRIRRELEAKHGPAVDGVCLRRTQTAHTDW